MRWRLTVNTFNKVVVVILLVFLFLLLLVTAAIPDWILRALQSGAQSLTPLLSASGRLIVAAAAIVLWLVVLALLWLEFRPTRVAEIRVANAEGFESHVSATSVSRRLEQSLVTIPGVRQARARLEENKQGVVATLSLDTRPDANVPSVSSAAVSQAHDVLANQVGAKVARVDVHIRHVTPAGKKREAVTAAPVPSQPAAAPWTPAPTTSADVRAQPSEPAWQPQQRAPEIYTPAPETPVEPTYPPAATEEPAPPPAPEPKDEQPPIG
jgi:hypothetical protein